jgi:hypothetical protein
MTTGEPFQRLLQRQQTTQERKLGLHPLHPLHPVELSDKEIGWKSSLTMSLVAYASQYSVK